MSNFEKEILNPWELEINYYGKYEADINIINKETGEIRQIRLDINDLNNIWREKEIDND